MSHDETKKFSLGRIVATPAALEALHDAGQQPDEFLARHVTGDWGDLDDEDKSLNDAALIDGSRISRRTRPGRGSGSGSSLRRSTKSVSATARRYLGIGILTSPSHSTDTIETSVR